MHLDVPTLMLAGAFVASVSGAFLLYAWYQYRETMAALWWAGADVVLAASILLIAIGGANERPAVYGAGLVLLTVSASFTFAGTRSFAGARVSPLAVAAGPLLWLGSPLLGPVPAAALHAAIQLSYYALSTLSVYRSRNDALRGRLPLAVLIGLHGLTQLLAVLATADDSMLPGDLPPVVGWFGIIHFETLVFVIGTSMFLVAMMKERNERRLSLQSSTDPLTGLLNRRGFTAKAGLVLEQAMRDGSTASVIVFDLDRFKSVNDRFGHGVGDRLLQVFGESCRSVMRPGDVTGRIGGEEFAAILPGFGVEACFAMAERVRKAFAVAGASVDGQLVNATVSAGVAATRLDVYDIDELLRRADAALYRAKDRGRNRVETAAPDPVGHRATNIIRVA